MNTVIHRLAAAGLAISIGVLTAACAESESAEDEGRVDETALAQQADSESVYKQESESMLRARLTLEGSKDEGTQELRRPKCGVRGGKYENYLTHYLPPESFSLNEAWEATVAIPYQCRVAKEKRAACGGYPESIDHDQHPGRVLADVVIQRSKKMGVSNIRIESGYGWCGVSIYRHLESLNGKPLW